MTLTRGARITGAALCGVLALITGAWIVRDISASDDLADFLEQWASDPRQSLSMPTQVSSPVDGALVAVYVGTAVAVLRSSVAASALLATAVLTLAVRLPGLWVLTASWAYLQPTESLRTRGLLSTFAVLGLAIGLAITAVAGRSPPDAAGRPQDPRAAPARPMPTRPTSVVAWLAGALLLLDAALITVWQIRFGYAVGQEVYLDSMVGGERVAQRLLAPPSGWLAATAVVLGLTAGVGLLARAVFSRPLGAMLAVNTFVSGAVGTYVAVHLRIFENFGAVPLEYQLVTATSLFEVITGPVLIVLLTRRGERGPMDDPRPGAQQPPPGYGHPPGGSGYGGPPPPSSRPPNW